MLNQIILFSLKNRLLILVLAVVLMLAGLWTSHSAEVDVFPDLNAPTVVVMTEAGGMAAEEVEQLVTFPIETSVNGSQGVRRVRSSSTNGFSVVWVEFDWGTDIYIDRQVVSEKIATIREQLPQTVSQPMLGPQSSILGEVFIIGLTADSTSATDLRTIADWTLRPRLLATGGVAQVSVLGGDVKEYQVRLNPLKMKHLGVSLDEVIEATEAMNLNTNGGVVNSLGKEYIVRGIVASADVEQMARTVVKQNNGHPIVLADIADVTVGTEQPRMGAASVKGKEAVLLTVTKQPNTNTVALTAELERVLDASRNTMPADVRLHTDIFRQADFINASIDNVKTSLIEGCIMVVIVLLLFLANVRATIISIITLPLALMVSVLILYLFGFTLNTMSLGGMAIAIGSLVDDAIVDVENVWRHLNTPGQKTGKLKIIYEASREVRMPILNSTLIIVVSFLPLFFLSGMEGRMLVPLGIAFIVALTASTLVALTLTPVLCSYLLKEKNNAPTETNNAPTQTNNTPATPAGATPQADTAKVPAVVAFLQRHYTRALTWALDHPRPVLAATAAALVLTLIALCNLGNTFLPPFNEGSLTINVSTVPGVSLDESVALGRQAEEILMQVPEITTVARKTGRAEMDEHALGVNVSEIEAPFTLKDRSQQDFMSDVRTRLSDLRGVSVEIGQPISHRIDAMLSGTQAGIAIKIFGPDLNRLFLLGNSVKQAIAGIEGVADLNVEQQIERPQLEIIPRRDLLAKHGITPTHFSHFVSVNMAGRNVAQVYDGGRSFNLVVRTDQPFRSTPEQIADLIIDCPDGEKIPLSSVADIVMASGPNTINRENVQRKVVVSANAAGRDMGSVVTDIQSAIAKEVTLPDGYHIELGGQFESEQRATRILTAATALCFIIIFLLLCLQFNSARESAVILLNLPLALIGGVLALWLGSGNLSIPAIIGFISLFGIATRGGMLLISQYKTLAPLPQPTPTANAHTPQPAANTSLRHTIIQGSRDRLNPILMTALTSALALIPLALRADLPGNEIQSPMAKVILGGLITSTFLNLFIIPIIYERLNRK